jgi:hypothetical protein
MCLVQKTHDRVGEAYAHWTQSVNGAFRNDTIGTGVRLFPTLESAIKWHNENCTPEYGLTVNFDLEDLMSIATNTIVETYNRKVFSVQAIKVDEDNMQHIANWCGGKVSTTKTGVPFVEVPTGKEGPQTYSRAFVGSWVVTGRGGYFSSYSDKAFQRTFEKG